MKFHINSIKTRFFLSLIAASCFLLDAQSLFAATEEAPQEEPVWVLSYAAFIFYATAVIMIAIFFSKRRETLLDMENQKKVAQIRANRVVKRRKEEQRARMQAAKAKK
ncbi:MAG: hypothetical protein ACI4NP_01875 [Thermoguttaceae bacterium]